MMFYSLITTLILRLLKLRKFLWYKLFIWNLNNITRIQPWMFYTLSFVLVIRQPELPEDRYTVYQDLIWATIWSCFLQFGSFTKLQIETQISAQKTVYNLSQCVVSVSMSPHHPIGDRTRHIG